MNAIKLIKHFIAYTLFLIIRKIYKIKVRKIEKNKNNYLFINLGLIGDVTISSIIFLNEEYLSNFGQITFLVNSTVKGLFDNYSKNINLIYVDRKKYRKSFLYRIRILNKLTKHNYCKVLNLSFMRYPVDDEITIVSALIGRSITFSNSQKISRYFQKHFDIYYTKIIDRDKNLSDIENLAMLLKREFGSNIIVKSRLFSGTEILYNLPEKYLAIAPVASEVIKTWDKYNYKKIIDNLSKKNIYIIVLHSEKINDIYENTNVKNLSGKTKLSEVITIIKNAQCFIGNDSGLLHIAKAVETVSFGIVGGGVWGRIYPYTLEDCTKYFFSEMKCFNCDWSCKYEIPLCLHDVKVEQVLSEVLKYLSID